MDITLFDLITIIKDTEKPFILTIKNNIHKYRFAEVATDSELLDKLVAGVRVDTFDGRPSYIVKIRG